MDKLLYFLRLLLLALSGLLLLCIVFISIPELANSSFSARLYWFQLSILILAISTLVVELTIKKSRFKFSIPDILLLLLLGTVLITYDKELNLQPEKLLFISQLVVLWFILRATMQKFADIRVIFLVFIMSTAFFGSILGVEFLHKTESFDHLLLKQIEDTFSPTALTGYIAIILPLCLSILLRLSNCTKSAWWEIKTIIYHLSWICFILIIVALSIGGNRYIWIATVVACLWVCWFRLAGWEKTKEIIRHNHKIYMVLTITLFILLTIIPEINGLVNPVPSDKRIFIWNITTRAILKHPVAGTGLGSFSATYAREQAEYFSTSLATESEKEMASTPDSAYNDFLFIGLELGIGGLLFFCLWLMFTIYYGIKHRQIGATGSVLALTIYAMYSSPLQNPSFVVLLIFLTAICTTKPKYYLDNHQKGYPCIGILAALIACILFFSQRDSYHVYKEWNTLRSIYKNKNYTVAAQGYTCLYPRLCYEIDFLMEGADCLTNTGQYKEAIIWLEQGMRRSANPLLYEEMAKNQFLLGQNKEAEIYLLEIIRILPGRIYPYYLLARLYATPSYFKPEKLKYAAQRVLSVQGITDNQITTEMRREISHILNEKLKDE